LAKEKEPKNIYAKMASVKSKLLGIRKGGVNEFSKYNYFELGDILPVLTPALEAEGLYMKTQFSATEQVAKLIIIDIDNTESTIEFEIKFAECALKGAHEIQNLGAAQTYTRRYLIMTAFDVAEADMVDAGAEKDEKKEAQKKAEQEKAKQQPASKSQQAQPAKATQPQEDINQLRRDVWELIKKLPKDEQGLRIAACKGADAARLKEFIKDLNTRLNAETQETALGDKLRETRILNTADTSTLGEELANQAAQETAPEDQMPAELRDKELEIY